MYFSISILTVHYIAEHVIYESSKNVRDYRNWHVYKRVILEFSIDFLNPIKRVLNRYGF